MKATTALRGSKMTKAQAAEARGFKSRIETIKGAFLDVVWGCKLTIWHHLPVCFSLFTPESA